MKKILSLILVTVLISSCSKELDLVSDPVLSVQLNTSNAFKAGEPVKFDLSGKSDLISVFTGEVFRDYAFREGRKVDTRLGDVFLSFRTAVELGTQSNQLSVLVSTDFNGDYSNLSSVQNATWTDITGRFSLATNANFRNSSVQSIKDLFVDGRPVYLAFRYKTLPQVANGSARRWLVESIALTSSEQLNGQNLQFENLYSAGWQLIDQNSVNAPAQSSISQTRITMRGNEYNDPSDPDYDPANPWNDPESEHWVISKALSFEEVNLGPDRPVAVKGVTNNFPSEYEYTYDQPGNYQVVFVATNATIKETRASVVATNITIVP